MNEYTLTIIKIMTKKTYSLLIIFIAFTQFVTAQTDGTTNVTVDKNGILRWANNEEIKGFGVNYTTPFAHAYRSAKKMGIDPLKAIDEDIYHFSRLGFDLFRVHVWDTEISDTLGNLIFNEHLDAFDYLIKKLNERNINYVLTPIAFWGDGWPEPDSKTPGFSHKYGKDNCLTNPEAIAAQQNYLTQFMSHINPYTGIAYKDDPRLIAIEISNEPHHREASEAVTTFIQGMVKAVRKSGYQKPIFYNISHSVHLVENYFKADIQGGTFQWYCTGLGYGKELLINALINTDKYDIPFDDIIKKNGGAKIVYEFDAADIAKSYIYPAMARSFRTAGIQLATHFAYDPTFLAFANTEYNTHHVNLPYTPKKALSLMISSEVFHQIPMYQDFGTYPKNNNFGDFQVSFENDLAIFNTKEKFYHTNSTTAEPVEITQLKKIAGTGNSSIIEYDGTGAYFLDELENSIWRLEIMPDAAIVRNAYGRNSLDKTVAIVQWNERAMRINLENLGGDFQIIALNEKGERKAKNGQFSITPGVYLLIKKGITNNWKPTDYFKNIRLNEFHAPKSNVAQTYVLHKSVKTTTANEPLNITATIITPKPTTQVDIFVEGSGGWGKFEMKQLQGFEYEGTIAKDKIKAGALKYFIVVRMEETVTTFPTGTAGFVYDWDFYDRTPYIVKVQQKNQPIYLYDAARDEQWDNSITRWEKSLKVLPINTYESEYQINIPKLKVTDNENLNGKIVADYTIKKYLANIQHLQPQFSDKQKLVLKARALNNKSTFLQIALTTNDGKAYGKTIELKPEMDEYEILISDLEAVNYVIMPRPYPTFLPYFSTINNSEPLDITTIQGVQFSIGPSIKNEDLEEAQGVAIVSLRLE
jgi:hypothetical protein